MILDFGDTAATDKQITADMRHAGGYYVLARAGRFIIWASRAPTLARHPGGLRVGRLSSLRRARTGELPATPTRRSGKVRVLRQATTLGVRLAAHRIGRGSLRVRPRRRARLGRLAAHVAPAHGHGAAGRGQLLAADRAPEADPHASIRPSWPSYREHGETVDVFLPSCGEPLAVLDNTFRYVSSHGVGRRVKTVYVLDDSARDKVRDLAEEYNFRYIVRPNPGEMKKAGNLTHALAISCRGLHRGHRRGFRRAPEFLYETMPYFADPKIGIVQTAQFFDVSNRSFSYIQRYAGTLQEIFFRFIQPARDRYKAAICAGTNLVYRRAAVCGCRRLRSGADRRGCALRGEAVVGRIRDPLSAALPGQGRRASRLPVAGESAGTLVPFLDDADDRKALPGGAVHLEAARGVLGGFPLLHVIGRVAADRTVPDADDDLVLPAAGLPAQLPADPAGARGDAASLSRC